MEALTPIAIAVLIATKALEKTGENLGEGIWQRVSQFLARIRHKSPDTATAITEVAEKPELAETDPNVYGQKVLIDKVETLAQNDPELQKLSQEIQTAIQAQPGAVVNLTKLAEKIGVVNQGTVINQNNTINL